MADLYRSSADRSRVHDWCRQRLRDWAVPHATETVVSSLGETHLTWAGDTDGALCVYLPGTNFNAATSTGMLTELSRTSRVVCADLPGQPGLSAPRRPEPEVPGYARWIGEVLQHVRERHPDLPLVLVGHSRGAAVALTADPADADALVLLSPAGLAGVRITSTVLRHSVGWLMRPSPARSRRLVGLMAGGAGDPALDQVVEWMTLVARCTRTTGAPGALPSTVRSRWRGRSVQVLVGERDVFFPPGRLAGPASELGAKFEVVSGAGHLLVDQRPEAVAAAVYLALM